MWKEINSQLGVFLNIMNITGPSVYSARARFTLLHMAEALKLNADPETREFTHCIYFFFLFFFFTHLKKTYSNEREDKDSWPVMLKEL